MGCALARKRSSPSTGPPSWSTPTSGGHLWPRSRAPSTSSRAPAAPGLDCEWCQALLQYLRDAATKVLGCVCGCVPDRFARLGKLENCALCAFSPAHGWRTSGAIMSMPPHFASLRCSALSMLVPPVLTPRTNTNLYCTSNSGQQSPAYGGTSPESNCPALPSGAPSIWLCSQDSRRLRQAIGHRAKRLPFLPICDMSAPSLHTHIAHVVIMLPTSKDQAGGCGAHVIHALALHKRSAEHDVPCCARQSCYDAQHSCCMKRIGNAHVVRNTVDSGLHTWQAPLQRWHAQKAVHSHILRSLFDNDYAARHCKVHN